MKKWVDSIQARKLLKVSTCDLAHLRNGNQVESKKEGNKYLYSISVSQLKKKQSSQE